MRCIFIAVVERTSETMVNGEPNEQTNIHSIMISPREWIRRIQCDIVHGRELVIHQKDQRNNIFSHFRTDHRRHSIATRDEISESRAKTRSQHCVHF